MIHIEVGSNNEYIVLRDKYWNVMFHESGTVMSDDEEDRPMTVHQMHVLADWLYAQVERNLT